MQLEDLKKFCSEDETRPGLWNPFQANGYTYATDGRIMIKTPLIEGTRNIPEALKFEILDANIPKEEGIPVEYPKSWESFTPEIEKCHTCKGTGAIKTCRTCDGEGEITCDHCGHEDTCEDCRGKGIESVAPLSIGSELCEYCDGKGTIETTSIVSLNRGLVFVNFRYLEKIHSLPASKCFINKTRSNQDCIHFTFEKGEGVLMTMRNDSKGADATRAQWPKEAAIA